MYGPNLADLWSKDDSDDPGDLARTHSMSEPLAVRMAVIVAGAASAETRTFTILAILRDWAKIVRSYQPKRMQGDELRSVDYLDLAIALADGLVDGSGSKDRDVLEDLEQDEHRDFLIDKSDRHPAARAAYELLCATSAIAYNRRRGLPLHRAFYDFEVWRSASEMLFAVGLAVSTHDFRRKVVHDCEKVMNAHLFPAQGARRAARRGKAHVDGKLRIVKPRSQGKAA